MFIRSMLLALLVVFSFSSFSIGQAKPSATFDKIWIDYDVTQDGKLGMRIHTKFTVIGMKGVDSYQAIYFETGDGERLKDKNKSMYSTSGEVAVYRELKIDYDPGVYSDLTVFMPYDELDLAPGEYDLVMDVDLIYKAGGIIQHLTKKDFKYTKTGETKKPTAKFDRMWIDYGVTDGGRYGMRVHAKLTVYDMKEIDGYVAFLFQKESGDLLKTTNTAYSSKAGQSAVYFSIKPGYNPTVYDDVSAFMPYAEFNLGNGSYNLKIDADLLYKDGTLIQHLDFYDFVYKKGI